MRDAGYVYLDVRSVPEFDSGHPEGAFNVPWLEATANGMAQNAEFVAQISAFFPHAAKLVVGCKAGARSEQAAQALSAAGFSELVIQRAGMDGLTDPFGRSKEPGWRASSLPVAHEAASDRTHQAFIARARSR